MSYTQFFYHLIFRTKYSRNALLIEREKELYNYIWGMAKNKKSVLYRIGGMPDHIHLLVSIHPSLAVATFVREMKTQSHKWINNNRIFPEFQGWGDGYAGLTYCIRDREMISDYIKGQKEHHQKEDFHTEICRIMCENGASFDEKWFFKD